MEEVLLGKRQWRRGGKGSCKESERVNEKEGKETKKRKKRYN